MSERSASVVIVGAGIVGASVAYHLAVRGCHDVLILERADAPVTGSTARSAAGVRHQFGTAVNIRLSQYSIERLRRFGEEVGADSGLRQVGYLLLVDDAATWAVYQRNVALQNSLGVATKLLTPEDVTEIVPATRIDDLVGATFCAQDGYCDPHGVAMGYLTRARELGVRLECAAPVTGIRLAADGTFTVETPGGRVACETVVNAAGAWAGQLARLAGLENPVLPYRRCIYFTEPFAPIPRDVPLTIDVGSGFYLRKEHDNVLFGLSNPNEPSSERLDVDWEWLEQVLEAGVRRFPVLEEAGLAMKSCWAGLYEITPDHLPILGRHPERPTWVDANGFSGHGVLHSPATGMLMAEEILDGRAHTIDVDSLRLARFREGGLAHEPNIY